MTMHKFYAVTTTSVYLVSDEKNEYGWPTVEKIALDGQSRVKVGSRLKNGGLVAVARDRIFLYDGFNENTRRSPERINTRHWGGITSGIVGLFLHKKEAMICFKEKDKIILDPRWKIQTDKVRDRIGSKHPVFVLSDISFWALNLKKEEI